MRSVGEEPPATSRSRAQRLAEHLIRRACRRLPDDTRDDRYREWTAELHAILHDPRTRPRARARRALRALLYAADHTRSTRRLARAVGHPSRHFVSARYDQLMPAAVMCSAAGTATGIAILIWSPSYHQVAGWTFTATIVATFLFWRRPLSHPKKRFAGRSRRLRRAALMSSSVGLATAIPIMVWSGIWSPLHQELASAILAASMTVTSVFWWRAHRRPRHKTP